MDVLIDINLIMKLALAVVIIYVAYLTKKSCLKRHYAVM